MPPSLGQSGKSASSIAEQLRKSLSGNSHIRHDRTRINIISPTLCDAVLRRLQPSFPTKGPVDIIDINPGVCLWSSKIHHALKPRHHILVEPDKDIYAPYLEPLLQEQGSRYRHVPLLSDLFTGPGAGYLPDQIPVESRNILKGHRNDTLLILANLTRSIITQTKSDGSASVKSVHQYINGMMNPEKSFHHYGLVRMLAWVSDGEKGTFIPRTVTDRKKLSVRLDLGTEVSEIAGGVLDDSSQNHARRQHSLTVQGEQLAAQRAKYFGVWDPKNRRPPPSTPPWYEIGLVPDAFGQLRKLPYKLPWQQKMLALDDEWNKAQGKAAKQSSAVGKRLGRPRGEEPKDLRLLRTKFLTTLKAKCIPQEWASRQNDIDKAEIEFLSKGLEPQKLAANKDIIQQKSASLQAEMDRGRKDLALLARKYIDDRRGFEQQPPLLQWDRRMAEPLIVRDDEFYPAKKMALLDLKPVPGAVDKLNDFDKRICLEYLLATLFRNPAQSVCNDLTAAVQGGLEDFLERIPDLKNPLKGGNSDLDDLRVRTLPVDLLVEIALALEGWPFRMQTHEMIMATGKRTPNVLVENA